MAKKIKLTNDDDNFKGSGKDEIINARDGNDVVSGGGGNDTINGGEGNDFLRGGNGDDTLNGGLGDDRLAGGEGDDTLNGGAGINIVDGGLGDDLVVLDGNFADAKITSTDTGFKIVTALGTTTVTNVESFQFADGVKGAGELLPGAGKTFVLTVPIDNIVGTSGDDTIVGDNTTFTADLIAGGDGKDVLKIATTGAATNGTPTMSGVERIEVTGSAAALATNINFVNTTGVTTFALNSGNSAAALTSVKSILDLELSNTTAGVISVAYDAAAVVGVTDTQKVSVNNAVLTSLTVNGAETLAITAAGTANNLGTVTDAAAKAITVAGAGAVTLATANTTVALASFDASAATGKVSVTFGATSDVVSKGGAADDSFVFGGTFTSKDTVDGGAGKDTVSLDGGSFLLTTDDAVKGLNALTNVETIRFTGATATSIDRATLTTAIAAYDFAGTAAVNVANAKATDTFSFSNSTGSGAVTFTGAGSTLINIAAAGTEFVAGTSAYADADIGGITAAAATILNIASTGLAKDANGLALASNIGVSATDPNYNDRTEGNVNDLGTVTGAANAVINLTGNAHTSLTLGAAATLDASKLTGDLLAVGSAGNDTIKGSAGVNEINGWTGTDTIDISASAAKVDFIHLDTISSSADRDIVTGFKAAAGGDVFVIDSTKTTAATLSTAAPVIVEDTTAGNGATVATNAAATDILEFNFNNVTTSLGDGSANSLDGTNLIALTGAIAEAANGESDLYLVAYQAGNAYVYVVNETNNADSAITAGEIQLLAEVKGVAVGALDVGNFDFL